MATAILDIELRDIPDRIEALDRYRRAMCLVRLDNRPVGRITLPVTDGVIEGRTLRAVLVDSFGDLLAYAWLHDEFLGLPADDESGWTFPLATVVVCTRDRADDLEGCLKALAQLPNDGQEILVVDNSPSTDATERLVRTFPHIRYVREDRPGLDNARNRGLQEAAHPVVAFTDDDARPDPEWLRSLLPNFADPLVLAVTGLVMPLELENDVQELFEHHTSFVRGFKRRVLDGTTSSVAAAGTAGAGANMALRRDVLERIGPFDPYLDAGTPSRSGGDQEMFARILGAGYRIVYEPSALCWHRHRQTRDDLKQTMYGYGSGVYAAWTRSTLIDQEWSVPWAAGKWFLRRQARELARSVLRRPGSLPLDLIAAEVRGAVSGPWNYLKQRRQPAPNRVAHDSEMLTVAT